MGLHAHVYVNGEPIGWMFVQRRGPRKPTPDTVCRYDWSLEGSDGKLQNSTDTPVEHRYGDGCWVLIARVLAAAGYPGGSVPPTIARGES